MLEMVNNKLMIAAAGSGKTQFIVNRALEILEKDQDANILIVTYTINNREEIRERFLKLNNQHIPKNVTIETWFSFLLQHGAKPYKYDVLEKDFDIKGILLVNKRSGEKARIIDPKTNKEHPIYWGEKENINKHYFTKDNKIYTDKLSKFVFRCNEKSNGLVISRLSEIYTHIFVDEVQDLAGYDLELLKLLLKSGIEILMVGDPRQVVYITHHEAKYSSYKNGKIKEFVETECNKKRKKICEIDEITLNNSHRNRKEICDFSSNLYPSFKKIESCHSCIPSCHSPDNHVGIFIIKSSDIEEYLKLYSPVQLRDNIGVKTNEHYASYNFGASKGKTFARVLVYPTGTIAQYLKDGQLQKEVKKNGKTVIKNAFSISDFYVVLTRAKYSVGIVLDFEENDVFIEGIKKWKN